jgi:hypothetical protein
LIDAPLVVIFLVAPKITVCDIFTIRQNTLRNREARRKRLLRGILCFLRGVFMARPRIFISSTYYDLKHIRASLEFFISNLGFDPVLSEKGDIAYTHDRPLDQSCYREVENCDLFILIVGGRYGSEVSSGSKTQKEFFDRYESITKTEYDSAVARDIPIYILIEKGVHGEYQTFTRNKTQTSINYAHVDSVNVFVLIEDILAKPRNNPIQTFDKFEEIESWLREQWAGLFRELLRRQSQQQQLAGLSQQILQLKETNETLKKYLEAVMRGADSAEKTGLIESEEKRLLEVKQMNQLRHNAFITTLEHQGVTFDDIVDLIKNCDSIGDFRRRSQTLMTKRFSFSLIRLLMTDERAREDFNDARRILGVAPLEILPLSSLEIAELSPLPTG